MWSVIFLHLFYDFNKKSCFIHPSKTNCQISRKWLMVRFYTSVNFLWLAYITLSHTDNIWFPYHWKCTFYLLFFLFYQVLRVKKSIHLIGTTSLFTFYILLYGDQPIKYINNLVAVTGVEPAISWLWAENDFPFHSTAMWK